VRSLVPLLTLALVFITAAARGDTSSLETLVNDADAVVIASVGPRYDGWVHANGCFLFRADLAEAIKGRPPAVIAVPLDPRRDAPAIGGERHVFLLRATGESIDGTPAYDTVVPPVPLRGQVDFWRMDATRVTDAAAFLAAVRGEARRPPPPGRSRWPNYAFSLWNHPAACTRAVPFEFVVPADDRLAHLVAGWLDSPDPDLRLAAASALSAVDGPSAVGLLRRAAADPHFEEVPASEWPTAPEWRSVRVYPVRREAAAALAARGIPGYADAAVLPGVQYRPLPVGRWSVAALATAIALALAGRRRGALRRVTVGGAVLLAAAVLLADARSRGAADTVAFAIARQSHVLTIAGGTVSLVRVGDDAPTRAPLHRTYPPPAPGVAPVAWQEPGLTPSATGTRLGVTTSRGAIAAAPNHAYHRIALPARGLAAALALIPALALATAATRRLRRRRRTLIGHCPACAYDLRGAASARCPECGAPAPPRPPRAGRRAAALMTVAVSLLALSPAARALFPIPFHATPTLESLVNDADVVLVGRVRPPPGAAVLGVPTRPYRVAVTEVLKGPRHASVVVPLDPARAAAAAAAAAAGEADFLFLLRHREFDADGHHDFVTLDSRPGSPLALTGPADVWRMDGRHITRAADLLAATRDEARRPPPPGGGDRRTPFFLDVSAAPATSPLARVPHGKLWAVVDDRLPHLARAWLDSPDPGDRITGARAMEPLRGPDGEARLRRALWDPHFELKPDLWWHRDPAWRTVRRHTVADAAARTLSAWGAVSRPSVAPTAGRSYHPANPWPAAAALLAAAVALTALAGRRRHALRRTLTGSTAILAIATTLLVCRSHRVSDTFAWSTPGHAHELALSAGRLTFLRVADPTPAPHPLLRRTDPAAAAHHPWYAAHLLPAEHHVRGPFELARGQIASHPTARPCTFAAAPAWPIPAALAAPAALALAHLGLRHLRRRHRRRHHRCPTCNYDLRHTATPRCPECGAWGIVPVAPVQPRTHPTAPATSHTPSPLPTRSALPLLGTLLVLAAAAAPPAHARVIIHP
jgi:predicted RNA-binding Zn-ribbon protein involved in translation (DUF1610 family)